MPLFFIFLAIPIIELMVFFAVIDEIGALPAIIITILTALIGSTLIKRQGVKTVFEARGNLASGAMPVDQIFDGFCLVVAGAFLITPGFVSDSIGFSLLVPPIRRAIQSAARGRVHVFGSKTGGQGSAQNYGRTRHTRTSDEGIIEGEYESVEDGSISKDNANNT